MEKKLKAVGYVRVSTPGQEDYISLEDQERAIKDYCDTHGWELLRIYGETVSGKNMDLRLEMQHLLTDAIEKRFDAVVVHKWDRFARDFDGQRANIKLLKATGCDIHSILQPGEIKTYTGQFVANIWGSVSELESFLIKHRMLGAKVSYLKEQDRPTCGELPFGRYYEKRVGKRGQMVRDYEKGMQVDGDKRKMIECAAIEYLKGRSLKDIALELPYKNRKGGPMHVSTLTKILRDHCGDEWTLRFKPQEEIPGLDKETERTIKIPRLLDEVTIKRIHKQMEHNKKYDSGTKGGEFPLTGFLKCAKCGMAFTGMSQGYWRNKRVAGKLISYCADKNKRYRYYRHSAENMKDCKADYIQADKLEEMVLNVIFDNTHDRLQFEQAVKENLPDRDLIERLKREIQNLKKVRDKAKSEYKKLLGMILAGKLDNDDYVKEMQEERRNEIDRLESAIKQKEQELNSLPNLGMTDQEIERARLGLLNRFHSKRYMKEMTFKDKKIMLKNLFSGEEKEERVGDVIFNPGKKRGIYLRKLEHGRVEIEFLANVFWGLELMDEYEAEQKRLEAIREKVQEGSAKYYNKKLFSL